MKSDGLLNTGQLEYHVFITAINIPAHHRHLHHHMCTLQTSAVHRCPLQQATMLQSFASAAATVQCSSGGGCTTHHWRLPHNAAVAGAAAQRRSGRRRVVAQHACNNFQHAAPVCCPTSRRLKISYTEKYRDFHKNTELYKKNTELEISCWNVLFRLRSEVAYIGSGPILP